jgi:hypothetical protein
MPLFLYKTLEISLDLSNSLIIKPSLWLKPKKKEEFRYGSDIGLRYYFKQKGEGIYTQASVGVFYYCYLSSGWDGSIYYDAMGYLGYSHKFSSVTIYYDVGIGYMSRRDHILGNITGDYNIGIGFKF